MFKQNSIVAAATVISSAVYALDSIQEVSKSWQEKYDSITQLPVECNGQCLAIDFDWVNFLSDSYDSVSEKLGKFKCIYSDESCLERADYEVMLEELMKKMHVNTDDLPVEEQTEVIEEELTSKQIAKRASYVPQFLPIPDYVMND